MHHAISGWKRVCANLRATNDSFSMILKNELDRCTRFPTHRKVFSHYCLPLCRCQMHGAISPGVLCEAMKASVADKRSDVVGRITRGVYKLQVRCLHLPTCDFLPGFPTENLTRFQSCRLFFRAQPRLGRELVSFLSSLSHWGHFHVISGLMHNFRAMTCI